MLSWALGAHSRVSRLKESHFFGGICQAREINGVLSSTEFQKKVAAMIARDRNGIWGGGPEHSDMELASSLSENIESDKMTGAMAYLVAVAHICAKNKTDVVCEHTPRNVFYLRELMSAIPNAKIVHMMRDPRAVLASQKGRWRQRQLGAEQVPFKEVIRVWFNYHPKTNVTLWLRASQAALQAQTSNGGGTISIRKFEAVVADMNTSIRDIAEFCELDFEEGMLDVPQAGSSHFAKSAKSVGVRREVNAQWKKVLSKAEIFETERRTFELLDLFDYPKPIATPPSLIERIPSLTRYPLHLAGVVLSNPKRAWVQLKAIFN